MAEADIILKFEIVEGLTPAAENVANALLAWVDVMKVASSIVEPGFQLHVGLAGVEDGSDIFKLTLDRIEGFGEHLVEGMKEYPLVSKATITLGGAIGGTLLAVSAQNMLVPDPRIPDDQMAVFERNNELLEESIELQKEQMRFYGILQDDRAFERFDVIRAYDNQTVYSIPRSEFAARSGLWTGDDETVSQTTATRTATWEVVLIKAVLVPEPRRWLFAKDGIEFSARMDDKDFLEALHDRTLPIRIAEGVRMKLEVKYREEFDGEAWIPVRYSHRVSKVLEPLPPPTPTPLFAHAGTP